MLLWFSEIKGKTALNKAISMLKQTRHIVLHLPPSTKEITVPSKPPKPLRLVPPAHTSNNFPPPFLHSSPSPLYITPRHPPP